MGDAWFLSWHAKKALCWESFGNRRSQAGRQHGGSCLHPARAVTAGMSYRASAPAGNLANPKFTPFFYKSGW